MYIVTRKGSPPEMYQSLQGAVQEAVKIQKPSCWVWKVEVTRLGTLKRIEIAREEIQETGVKGIACIKNRFRQDQSEPADGQIYFANVEGRLKFLVYRREEEGEEVVKHD